MEGRGVSTVSRNRNSLRKQSSNTKKISKLLGISAKNIKAGESTGSGVFDRNVEHFYDNEGKVSGRSWKSAVGNLSRVDLQAVDTVGRKIPEAVLNEFVETAFKTSDGKMLSLYHWTDAEFNKFAKGDIGYHFGILEASNRIMSNKQGQNMNNNSIFKEVYLNIKNHFK